MMMMEPDLEMRRDADATAKDGDLPTIPTTDDVMNLTTPTSTCCLNLIDDG